MVRGERPERCPERKRCWMPDISQFPSGSAWPAAARAPQRHQHFPKRSRPWKRHLSAKHPALVNQRKSTALPAAPPGLQDALNRSHSPGLHNTHLLGCCMVQAAPSQPAGIYPSHPQPSHPPGTRGLSLTGHREIFSRLSGASRNRSSCCCSSSALSGHGSWTRSGCTLRGERGSALREDTAACPWGVSPMSQPAHPRTRGREDKAEEAAAACGTPGRAPGVGRAPSVPKPTPKPCAGSSGKGC